MLFLRRVDRELLVRRELLDLPGLPLDCVLARPFERALDAELERAFAALEDPRPFELAFERPELPLDLLREEVLPDRLLRFRVCPVPWAICFLLVMLGVPGGSARYTRAPTDQYL